MVDLFLGSHIHILTSPVMGNEVDSIFHIDLLQHFRSRHIENLDEFCKKDYQIMFVNGHIEDFVAALHENVGFVFYAYMLLSLFFIWENFIL